MPQPLPNREEIVRAVKLAQAEGKSVRLIAKELGVPRTTLRHILEDLEAERADALAQAGAGHGEDAPGPSADEMGEGHAGGPEGVGRQIGPPLANPGPPRPSSLKRRPVDAERKAQREEYERQVEDAIQGFTLTTLQSLTNQSRLAGDIDWLRKFSPQQLALIHGTSADKLALVHEADSYSPGRSEAPAGEASTGAGTGLPGSGAGGARGTIRLEYVNDNSTTAHSASGADEDQA